MIHNETCNIWTHLLGVVLFATITITMASGWGHKRMPALPESWVTGADEARRGLVRRTDAARTAAADAAHNLADLGARLAEKAHLLDWTHQWPEHLLDWTHQWPSSHRGDAEEREASTIGASSPGAPPTVATPERRDPRADDADDEFERVSESNGVEQECLGEEEKDAASAGGIRTSARGKRNFRPREKEKAFLFPRRPGRRRASLRIRIRIRFVGFGTRSRRRFPRVQGILRLGASLLGFGFLAPRVRFSRGDRSARRRPRERARVDARGADAIRVAGGARAREIARRGATRARE